MSVCNANLWAESPSFCMKEGKVIGGRETRAFVVCEFHLELRAVHTAKASQLLTAIRSMLLCSCISFMWDKLPMVVAENARLGEPCSCFTTPASTMPYE